MNINDRVIYVGTQHPAYQGLDLRIVGAAEQGFATVDLPDGSQHALPIEDLRLAPVTEDIAPKPRPGLDYPQGISLYLSQMDASPSIQAPEPYDPHVVILRDPLTYLGPFASRKAAQDYAERSAPSGTVRRLEQPR